jgi:hypothetical protein
LSVRQYRSLSDQRWREEKRRWKRERGGRRNHHNKHRSDSFVTAGNQNSYLVKRTKNAKVQFSRDPLNLTNVHSRKVRFRSTTPDLERITGFAMSGGFVFDQLHAESNAIFYSTPVSSTTRYEFDFEQDLLDRGTSEKNKRSRRNTSSFPFTMGILHDIPGDRSALRLYDERSQMTIEADEPVIATGGSWQGGTNCRHCAIGSGTSRLTYPKAVGIVANTEGGVQVISKTKAANKPAAGRVTSNQGANKSARK